MLLVDDCFSVLNLVFDLSLCRDIFVHTISGNIGIKEAIPPSEKGLRVVLLDTERLVVNIMAVEKTTVNLHGTKNGCKTSSKNQLTMQRYCQTRTGKGPMEKHSHSDRQLHIID